MQMYDRAMQQSDAKVNKTLDFLVDKTELTPLFSGHKPLSVMIDTRNKMIFAKIVANRDQLTLQFTIFKT